MQCTSSISLVFYTGYQHFIKSATLIQQTVIWNDRPF